MRARTRMEETDRRLAGPPSSQSQLDHRRSFLRGDLSGRHRLGGLPWRRCDDYVPSDIAAIGRSRLGERLHGPDSLPPVPEVAHEVRFLEVVILDKDLPGHGLRKDDLGTVVELYAPDEVEVEFVNAAGHTEALVPLGTDAIRSVSHHDSMAVRRIRRTA